MIIVAIHPRRMGGGVMSETVCSDLIAAIENAAVAQGLTRERMRRLTEEGIFELLFSAGVRIDKQRIMDVLGISQEQYVFSVNYGLRVDGMIRGCRFEEGYQNNRLGNWIVELPDHNLAGAVSLQGKIFEFDPYDPIGHVHAVIERAQMRVATLYELLGFAKEFWYYHRTFNSDIVALGTSAAARLDYGGVGAPEVVCPTLSRRFVRSISGACNARESVGFLDLKRFDVRASHDLYLGVKEV